MRILFLSQSCAIYGGVERWLADLCIGLKRTGLTPIIVLAKGSQYHRPSKYLSAYPELSQIEVREADASSGINSERVALLERVIKDIRPDIVIPVLLNDGILAAIKRRKSGQQFHIVYPVHENDIWAFNAVKKYQASIDMLVSVNKLFVDVVKRWLAWSPQRIRHVRCGATPSNYSINHKGLNAIHIGYCGKLIDKPKRAGDVIVLSKELDKRGIRHNLSVAGTGALEYQIRESLAAKVENNELTLFGQIEHDQLYRIFYPDLDILFIPSYSETGPLVAWEAMLHGVGLVSSMYRGLRREGALRNGHTALLFPVGNLAEAARCIEYLVNNSDRLRVIASNGQKYAGQYLTVRHMVDSWFRLLEDVQSIPLQGDIDGDCGDGKYNWKETYGLPVFLASRLRKMTGRLIQHGGSRSEWPMYLPGLIADHEVAEFDRRLWILEGEICEA